MTNASNYVSLKEIRQELVNRQHEHGLQIAPLTLLDHIENEVKQSGSFARIVTEWLKGEESTVYLRDEICEPFRTNPEIIRAGKSFNPSTEWANTWIPLDTAIHNIRRRRREVAADNAIPENHYASNPFYGMF